MGACREDDRRTRRGHDRHRAPGAGAKNKLSAADRILATILYLRKVGTQELVGELFNLDRAAISRAVRDVRPLLDQHRHIITPSTARFRTPSDVAAFLAEGHDIARTEIKQAC
ncbi:transposase family protein [Streptosporangium album]|uniref:transposase family protein n=1 Tax=Streptosporangium album TaxID=47479 RepID=UPI00248392F2